MLTTLVVFIAGLLVGYGVNYALQATAQVAGVEKKLPSEAPVGALLALTGELSTFSKRHEAAARMAINDVNAYLAKMGYNVKFKLLVEDTKVSKEEALARIQSLSAQGVKAVVGPLASSEVAAIKSFADSNKIVVVSHSSTAPSLAIPNDYVFRFVPTDLFQGKALARLLYSLGVRKAAVIYRGDDWGDGLFKAFKDRFEELGGEVKGTRYDPKAKDLSAEVRLLAETVSGFGVGDETGVLLISFEDDGVNVLSLARDNPSLLKVRWFGTDGTANSNKITEQVGDVAVQVGGFPNTVYGIAANLKQAAFAERFKSEYGEAPDAYTYNIYDAVWVVCLSIIEAGAYDGELIAKVLPDVASRYFGVSGWTLLDSAGDRAGGDYAIWKVVEKDGKYVWVEVGTYTHATDSVQIRS